MKRNILLTGIFIALSAAAFSQNSTVDKYIAAGLKNNLCDATAAIEPRSVFQFIEGRKRNVYPHRLLSIEIIPMPLEEEILYFRWAI